MLMESFNDALTKWQPFFTTAAGVAATLAGLLFVALSLNREKITAKENHMLLRLAQRSFGDFLFALFIALMFLIPIYEPRDIIISLSIIMAFRGEWLVRSAYRITKMSRENRRRLSLAREYVFQTISWLGLLAATIEIYRGQMIGTYLLVPVIATLLYNATRNAWQLLILEKRNEEQDVSSKIPAGVPEVSSPMERPR